MRTLLIIALTALVTVAGSAQTPNIDGSWYGTINPPGAEFDVALSFQKRGDGWAGTLLLENGSSAVLTGINAQGKTISFSLDSKQADAAFRGTISDDATTISGE